MSEEQTPPQQTPPTRRAYDKELEQYRSLMEVPGTFEDGFSWSSLVGAIFVALLMVPGAIYMQLLAGAGIGPAAQWVTVILFIEVARRAHRHLGKAEVFVLFYMAGAIIYEPYFGLLFRQFYAQSQAATGMAIAENLPRWFSPSDPDVLAQRSFFNPAWYPALGLFIFQFLLSRLDTTILSYGLFRLASDIEKLPFPMAPIGAQGITALVEQQSEESQRQRGIDSGNWRWRVFSIGGVLGLSFGALYTALPTFTGALLDRPITILPIPFVDWTPKTSSFLPAVATGISLNLGQFMIGMVLPFFAMLGSFLALVLQFVANPVLYKFGMLPSWQPSDDTIMTQFHNYMDFYFSFGLGVAGAIAIVGIWQVVRGVRQRSKAARDAALKRQMEEDTSVPEGRGDIPVPWILVTYLITSSSYILVSGYLINWHRGVMVVMVLLAYIYTPLNSYVTARLEGMAGQMLTIPFVREAAFIFSGFNGVKVWFLPIPLANYGRRTVFYRQAELTGTRFWSLWKAELILVPIILVSVLMFSQFIWSLAPIPSVNYPFAERMWELQAAQRSVIYSATMGRHTLFNEAFNLWYLLSGVGVGVLLFALLIVLGMPIMLAYGMVRGLNAMALPHVILPQFLGACLGRFYFERRMGLTWRKYVPVVAAGFTCGMGLVTVLGVGVTFLARAVIKIPF